MTQPRIALCTLALNEMEWLPRLYEQHRDWPGFVSWVFVEAVDYSYYQANVERFKYGHHSEDGTREYLTELADTDQRVRFLTVGLCRHGDPAQNKCLARDHYLRALDDVRPDFVFVLDADEFYTREHQQRINEMMVAAPKESTGFGFGLRSIWRPPSLKDHPLMSYEAIGGVFSVPICRGWRWLPGMEYRSNHNTPEVAGRSLGDRMERWWRLPERERPDCVHMGFTASLASRQAKHRYYEGRGEGTTDHRKRYVDGRRAWETWKPGERLPGGGRVIQYRGPVPEVFQ